MIKSGKKKAALPKVLLSEIFCGTQFFFVEGRYSAANMVVSNIGPPSAKVFKPTFPSAPNLENVCHG